ncbi:uncharacterized protein LOC6639279 [Drosophila willistoni]|nr:uncharacterized protein LOC6639279 [Drosophila willistoni]
MAQCPLIDDPTHPVMLPYPGDCGKYYVCFRRLAYARQCPLNSYWSPVTYRCDSKMLSNCQIDLPIYTDNQDFGIQYSPYPYRSCPENNEWNAALQRCEPSQFSNYLPWMQPNPTGNPTGIVPTAPTPPTLPALHPDNYLPIDHVAICKGNAINTYQPYPGDCHKFIHCGPQPTVITCAGQLFWNVKTQSCDVTQVGCQWGQ